MKPSDLYFYSIYIHDKFIVLMAAISEKWSSMCIFRRMYDDWHFALEQQIDLSPFNSSQVLDNPNVVEYFDVSEDRILVRNFDFSVSQTAADWPLFHIFKNGGGGWNWEETITQEMLFTSGEDVEINFAIHSDRLAVLAYSRSKKSLTLYILQSQRHKWRLVRQISLYEDRQKVSSPGSLFTNNDQGLTADSIILLSFIDDETLIVGSLIIKGPDWKIAGETTFSNTPDMQPNPKDRIYSDGSTAIKLADQEIHLYRRQGFKYELEKSFNLEQI